MDEASLITIKAKTPTGHIQEFRVRQILEIDGQPYHGPVTQEDVVHYLSELTNRVARLEERVDG